ncbi:MAG: hypothetical protein ABJA83_12820 [Burkholderiaceae bacterium]
MLLVLVLPWQAVQAVAKPAVHYHGAAAIGLLAKTDAEAVSALHVDVRHAAHEHQENGGVAVVQSDDSGPASAAHDTCTDVCCCPALAADGALPLATTNHHGLMTPFATHRLPSHPPGSLERPPRSFLV